MPCSYRSRLSALAGAFCLIAGASAWADVTIIGALSNFDVPNNTPEVCDEFEIEFEGPHSSDCYGTWGNYNYGPGRVVDNPAGTGIIVTYSRPGHSTQLNAIEHFGVHLTNFNLITARQFRWKHNGVVVTSGAGSPPVPIPVVNVIPATPTSPPEAVETIENEIEESIWVRRSVIGVTREVALSELMPDNPLILNATPLETELERLEPGETLEAVEPIEEDNIRAMVIVIETYADIATWNPAIGDYDHVAGELLSRAMNATIIEQPTCEDRPVIDRQPTDTHAPIDGGADFDCSATSPAAGGEVVYQWHHDGIDMEGEDTDHLNIDPITEASAGMYMCTITNDCGTVTTNAAQLFVDVRPTMVDQPAPFQACTGGSATFTATVAGSSPFSFVWQKGSSPLDMNNPRFSVHNTTFSSTLTISNIGPADAGTGSNGYRVAVTNLAGSRTSSRAPLTIGSGAAPTITSQPAPVTTCDGGNGQWSVTVSGAGPFTYVWRHDGAAIDTGADPRYTTSVSADGLSSTLTLTGTTAADTGSIDCLVGSSCGNTPSIAASLSVCAADWNCSGSLDSQDYFDFLEGFFTGNGDFNQVDGTDSQDYFDFLEAFFTGGC